MHCDELEGCGECAGEVGVREWEGLHVVVVSRCLADRVLRIRVCIERGLEGGDELLDGAGCAEAGEGGGELGGEAGVFCAGGGEGGGAPCIVVDGVCAEERVTGGGVRRAGLPPERAQARPSSAEEQEGENSGGGGPNTWRKRR